MTSNFDDFVSGFPPPPFFYLDCPPYKAAEKCNLNENLVFTLGGKKLRVENPTNPNTCASNIDGETYNSGSMFLEKVNEESKSIDKNVIIGRPPPKVVKDFWRCFGTINLMPEMDVSLDSDTILPLVAKVVDLIDSGLEEYEKNCEKYCKDLEKNAEYLTQNDGFAGFKDEFVNIYSLRSVFTYIFKQYIKECMDLLSVAGRGESISDSMAKIIRYRKNLLFVLLQIQKCNAKNQLIKRLTQQLQRRRSAIDNLKTNIAEIHEFLHGIQHIDK